MSEKTSKMRKKFDFGVESNITTLHKTSLDHSDAFGLSIHASVLKKKLSKEGTLCDLLLPVVAPPVDRSGRKTTTLVGDHEYFIPTKFHQNPFSHSGEEV